MSDSEQEDRVSSRVKLKYVKSNLFRVIHTDGTIADLSPSGNLTISLFSQRFTIPEEVILSLDEDGNVIGKPSIKKEKEDTDKEVIREVDILAVMDIDIARELAVQILAKTDEFYDETDELDSESTDE